MKGGGPGYNRGPTQTGFSFVSTPFNPDEVNRHYVRSAESQDFLVFLGRRPPEVVSGGPSTNG